MKNSVVVGLLIVLVLGLIFWARFASPDYKQVKVWNSYGVDCLPNGHQNLGQHIHPDLYVTVDGNNMTVPANIGINSQCMAELHTHDISGKIHIETVAPNKEMTLGQFMDMWGVPLPKDGYSLSVTLGSTTMIYDADPEAVNNHVLRDLEKINLVYTSVASSTAPSL